MMKFTSPLPSAALCAALATVLSLSAQVSAQTAPAAVGPTPDGIAPPQRLLAAPSPSSMPAAALINGRNFPKLNARNLGESYYVVAPPSPRAVQFSFKLKGYVFGFKMITAHFNGYVDKNGANGQRYAAYSDIKTSGLGALLKKMEIWAVSKGTITGAKLTPDFHVQQNMDGKERRVEMNYDNRAKSVDVNILPTLGSQGVPPASPAERFAANDTISAILAMMMRGQTLDAPFCEGTIPVFDSKQHYNLRLQRAGEGKERLDRKKVVTQVCEVYYEPVNGFDPEDLPDQEEASTPIKVEFIARPELGLYVPLKFTYKISSIKAVIKLDEMHWIIPPA